MKSNRRQHQVIADELDSGMALLEGNGTWMEVAILLSIAIVSIIIRVSAAPIHLWLISMITFDVCDVDGL